VCDDELHRSRRWNREVHQRAHKGVFPRCQLELLRDPIEPFLDVLAFAVLVGFPLDSEQPKREPKRISTAVVVQLSAEHPIAIWHLVGSTDQIIGKHHPALRAAEPSQMCNAGDVRGGLSNQIHIASVSGLDDRRPEERS
jgi:hypothetical protein